MLLRVVAVLLCAVVPLLPPAMPQASVTIDQLSWLSGCWSMARPDGVTEEQWMTPAGGTMIGMGRTVRGGRTTEYEFLQIREISGKLAYIAKPSGQAEATFPQKTLTADEVVFEDPAHDFPQRIIYRRRPDGSVLARIEGTLNGQTRAVDYPYVRCARAPAAR